MNSEANELRFHGSKEKTQGLSALGLFSKTRKITGSRAGKICKQAPKRSEAGSGSESFEL
nr:hypothetical protein [uncultured Cohaesibacter sp.]